MNLYLAALGIALLPAFGNFGGSLLSELLPRSRRILSLALHAAAGVILAVVGVELMPRALEAQTPWVVIVAFLLGGGTFIAMDDVVHLVSERVGHTSVQGRSWMIYFGVAVDLLSDGLMIGSGSTISLDLGLLLAFGQVTADIPEGFATTATFQERGMSRNRRLLASLSFIIPLLVGATIGFWAVRGRSELVKLSMLAFTAGILTAVTVEEIMPEAHEEEDARIATVALISGFALFAALSVYLV